MDKVIGRRGPHHKTPVLINDLKPKVIFTAAGIWNFHSKPYDINSRV